MPQTVLITGTSSGVGLAAAVEFAKLGWTVIATMRNLDGSGPLREAAASAGVDVDLRQLDTTDEESVRRCIDSVARDLGTIDVLVNNAGAGFVGTLELIPFQHLRDAMETIFFGTARVTRHVLPLQRKAGSGRIISVTSASGVVGTPFNDAYCSAKFAVEGLMVSLAPVVSRFGISVSIVEPGAIESPFGEKASRPEGEGEAVAAYAEALADYRAYITRTFAAPQSAEGVAATIIQAATDDKPAMRYQTSDEVRRIVGLALGDLTSNAMLEETTSWLAG
jgi:NAD(P)-dependent dehydrogenase (short-subunit alcohol dehydrogenase family)